MTKYDQAQGWFYLEGQERIAATLPQLKSLIEQGALKSESLVWHPNFGQDWRPVNEVALLGGNKPPSSTNDDVHSAAEAAVEQRAQKELERRQSLKKKVRIALLAVAMIAAVACGIKYLKWRSIYRDPLVVRYGEFSSLQFRRGFKQAAKYCMKGSTAETVILAEQKKWQSQLYRENVNMAGGISNEILFEKYALVEKKIIEDKQGAILKVHRTIRTFKGNTPAQQVLKSEHTVTLRKVDGEWKIKTFAINFIGAYDPYSGVEITAFGVE